MKKAWIVVHVSQPVIYLHVLQPGEFINKTWEQLKWGMELDHEINYILQAWASSLRSEYHSCNQSVLFAKKDIKKVHTEAIVSVLYATIIIYHRESLLLAGCTIN